MQSSGNQVINNDLHRLKERKREYRTDTEHGQRKVVWLLFLCLFSLHGDKEKKKERREGKGTQEGECSSPLCVPSPLSSSSPLFPFPFSVSFLCSRLLLFVRVSQSLSLSYRVEKEKRGVRKGF